MRQHVHIRAILAAGTLVAGIAAAAPPESPDLTGSWQASGKATEVENGPEMVRSTTGLPAGQQMGVIGSGPGAYAWGMRSSYKPYEVERSGALSIQPGGAFSWTSATRSHRTAACVRLTEFNMRGTSAMQGSKLVLDIASGEQKVSYSGCGGSSTPPRTESLAGQKRSYETSVEGGQLKIRQVQPLSSISSSAVYTRS